MAIIRVSSNLLRFRSGCERYPEPFRSQIGIPPPPKKTQKNHPLKSEWTSVDTTGVSSVPRITLFLYTVLIRFLFHLGHDAPLKRPLSARYLIVSKQYYSRQVSCYEPNLSTRQVLTLTSFSHIYCCVDPCNNLPKFKTSISLT